MRHYREGEAGDPVFERLLGIEMKREKVVARPQRLTIGRRDSASRSLGPNPLSTSVTIFLYARVILST